MDRGRRAMPTGNKACNERHVRKCQDLHRQTLASIKPVIDTKPPKTMRAATGNNAKKQQLLVSGSGGYSGALVRRHAAARSVAKPREGASVSLYSLCLGH
jgi:hypothetical protein